MTHIRKATVYELYARDLCAFVIKLQGRRERTVRATRGKRDKRRAGNAAVVRGKERKRRVATRRLGGGWTRRGTRRERLTSMVRREEAEGAGEEKEGEAAS